MGEHSATGCRYISLQVAVLGVGCVRTLVIRMKNEQPGNKHCFLDSLLCSLDLLSLSSGTSGATAFHNALFWNGLSGIAVGLS